MNNKLQEIKASEGCLFCGGTGTALWAGRYTNCLCIRIYASLSNFLDKSDVKAVVEAWFNELLVEEFYMSNFVLDVYRTHLDLLNRTTTIDADLTIVNRYPEMFKEQEVVAYE